MTATNAQQTTVPVAVGPEAGAMPAPLGQFVGIVTTDKALGLVVLGALGFLVVLRMTFRGSVI